MRIAISGSTGLIGTALVRSLRSDGHEVVRLVRGTPLFPDSDRAARWDPAAGTVDAGKLEGLDAVVNLSGRSIGAHRWSAAEKRALLGSRVDSTSLLATTIAGLTAPPPVLLSASAIGFYGDRGDEVLTEESPIGTGFLASVCEQWERAAAPAEAAGVRVTHLRTGLVLHADGGFLERPLQLFRVGLGGRIGTGRQWWSWISMADEIGAIRFLLDHDVPGPVNLAAPTPVTNADFTRTLGTALHRPTVVPVPRFAGRLVLGRELADEVVFAGQRVVPSVLEREGYVFAHPRLDEALSVVLGTSDRP